MREIQNTGEVRVRVAGRAKGRVNVKAAGKVIVGVK